MDFKDIKHNRTTKDKHIILGQHQQHNIPTETIEIN